MSTAVSAAEKITAYRQRYRTTEGHSTLSGDWLSQKLDELCTTKRLDSGGRARRSFDVGLFTEVLQLNGVDFSGPWADLPVNKPKGWQGRYRMNGRQKLAIMVARTERLKYRQGEFEPPKDWVDAMRDRFPTARPVGSAA